MDQRGKDWEERQRSGNDDRGRDRRDDRRDGRGGPATEKGLDDDLDSYMGSKQSKADDDAKRKRKNSR